MQRTRSIRFFSILISLMLMIGMISISQGKVLADTDTATGLVYEIENGEATITDFIEPRGFDGALIIPETLGGVPVTTIWGATGGNLLTSITIPKSVTWIHENFYHCDKLTSINVDPANTVYKSIDGVLYSKDGTELIRCPEGKSGSIVIPNGVTVIMGDAFHDCTNITSITIPGSVMSLNPTFRFCSALTAIDVDGANPLYKSVEGILYSKDGTELIFCPEGKSGNITLPNGVTSIGMLAFENCSNLTGITIPSGVTSIEDFAFADCSALTSITIPDSVMIIGDFAFGGCSALTTITIPGSVMYIGIGPVASCSGLTAIIVDPANTEYKSSNGILYSKDGTRLLSCPGGKSGNIPILNGVTTIDTYAFTGCIGPASISIPDSVTSIEELAFSGCTGLTSVTIPDSVTSIANYTFSQCTSLTSVKIPSSVMTIGDQAFYNCTSLTSINIPSSVTTIGDQAFLNCPNLTAAYFFGDAPTMGVDVFYFCGKRRISENYYDDTSYFVAYYLSEKTGFTNPWNGYSATTFNLGVSYQTHIQDVGWQDYVSNGAASGTSGESKRLEAIHINLLLEQGGIEYRTHVQDIGWQGWVADNALSGTSGQSKRLEAIQIRLTEEAADEYDVYYRVHAQNVGWMGWAKNGESAGTAGYSYRLEAIEVKLVAKGGAAPGTTVNSFIDRYTPNPGEKAVSYKTHVQDIGWQNYVHNGDISGTSGQAKRLEGIQIKLENVAGGIEYSTHVQDIGWMDWVADDAMSGTSGQSKRLEAIKIRLTGEVADNYDIYYCVHAQNVGWLDWAKNGESAGTAGFSYRLEAIKIVLVPKGGPAPGLTTRAFVQG